MKLVVFLLLSAATMLGQIVPGRYIVELAGDPASAAVMKEGARFAARDPRFPSRRAAVRQAQSNARRGVASHGGIVLDSMDTVMNALIVSIPDANAPELLRIPGVVAVHPVVRARPALDHALPLHKVPDAWAALPLGQNSAGAGIKIGIIDSGIDVNHPAFSAHLPPVAGFPKVLTSSDLAFTNAKVIVAKNYTRLSSPFGGEPDANDRSGHGTGTATAAAGGPAVSPYGPIVGVAPQAYIGNYKVFDASGASFDAIIKAVDDAVADGMDVLNLSLEGAVLSYSDADRRSPAVAALEAATSAGVIVVVAAGNHGPGPSTLSNLANAPDVIAAGAIRNDRLLSFSVAVDGVAPYLAYAGDGANPGRAVSGPLLDVTDLDSSALACSPLPAGSAIGMVVLVLRGICHFEDKMNNVAAGGGIGAIIYNNDTVLPFGNARQLVGSATLPTLFMERADGIDLKARLANAPGLTVTLQFSQPAAFFQRPDLAAFSARGPSVGGPLKPDLVAVGQEIVTAAQNSFPAGDLYSTSGFVDTAGTSFSAPLVAGAAALLKGARPGLTVAQYRSLLINNASPAMLGPDTPATVSQAGAGVLNVAAALSGTVAANPTGLNFGTSATINQNQGIGLTISNIGTVADTYSVSVAPGGTGPAPTLSTSTFQLDPQTSQPIVLRLNAAGLAPGEYQGSIQVTGTVSSSVTAIPYWFAVPGSTPAGISILYSDIHDAANSTAPGAVIFRVVDVAGLPLNTLSAPSASISQGGGTVRNVSRIGTVPGTYSVDLQTGTGNMQVDISLGGVTQSVIVPVQ